MKKRWICPECGSGKLLTASPRKNNTGRYCLKCSEATGFLVERICPALEKKRAAGKAKSAAKARAKVDKARAKYVVNGVDVMDALQRIWRTARALEPNMPASCRLLTITRSKRNVYTSGRAWRHNGRVHLTAGSDVQDMVYVLAHEVAHHMIYARDRYAPAHGDKFKAAEAELLAETNITRPEWRTR